MITRAATAPQPAASVLRDPVLLLPVAVAAALGVGWAGFHAGISGSRVGVDLFLAWSLFAASLIALERSRWRHPPALFALAGTALLAGDLRWSGVSGLWTLGILLDSVWLALVVQLVLTFPDGHSWSGPARVTILGAYLVTLGGALAATLVATDSRDALSIFASQGASDAIGQAQSGLGFAVAISLLTLVAWRLLTLRAPARRVQAGLLIGTLLGVPLLAVTLAQQAVTTEQAPTTLDTVARAMVGLIPLGFITGIVWSRFRRTQATDLVVELRSTGPIMLRDRLARTLGDPTLQLAYRLRDGRYVDDSGQPVHLTDGPGRAVTLLTAKDEVVAALVHDAALLDEPALVESVGAAAELLVENERLAAEVRAQLALVRASRARLVVATDEERRRIERDLHDGAQQRLVALSIALGLAAHRSAGPAQQALLQAQDDLEDAIAELRQLARGIHPTILREEGLDAALDGIVRRAPLPVHVDGSIGVRLAPALELAAYFVISEALTNVAKHANATSATVQLHYDGAVLAVAVKDDGSGGARAAAGGGLAGLRDRVEALDGTLTIREAPDGGTTVTAEIQCVS
jgi:signal transduction histidine kinase